MNETAVESSFAQRRRGLSLKMMRLRFISFASIMCATMVAVVTAHANGSITGEWLTLDDKTGRANGAVEIVERNGEFVGYVRQVIPGPGENSDPLCEECPGEFKGKRVNGLQIMWGLRRSDDGYAGGHILDPDEGGVYRCNVTLSADGRQLQVRGYIGIPAFGRTHFWIRSFAGKTQTTAPR